MLTTVLPIKILAFRKHPEKLNLRWTKKKPKPQMIIVKRKWIEKRKTQKKKIYTQCRKILTVRKGTLIVWKYQNQTKDRKELWWKQKDKQKKNQKLVIWTCYPETTSKKMCWDIWVEQKQKKINANVEMFE